MPPSSVKMVDILSVDPLQARKAIILGHDRRIVYDFLPLLKSKCRYFSTIFNLTSHSASAIHNIPTISMQVRHAWYQPLNTGISIKDVMLIFDIMQNIQADSRFRFSTYSCIDLSYVATWYIWHEPTSVSGKMVVQLNCALSKCLSVFIIFYFYSSKMLGTCLYLGTWGRRMSWVSAMSISGSEMNTFHSAKINILQSMRTNKGHLAIIGGHKK